MKTFVLKIEQNGGEYYNYTIIKGKQLVKIDDFTVIVDGIEIQYNELIESIQVK